MSFVTTADSLKSKAHLSHIPTPMLIGAACLALLAVVGIGVGFVSFFGSESTLTVESAAEEAQASTVNEQADLGASSSEGEGASGPVSDTVMVHVSGEVGKPGVYELPADARVNDAVEAAGGMTKAAAADAVNLARTVADGEQVHIPSKEDVAFAGGGSAGGGQSGISTGEEISGQGSDTSGLVNINTADASELDTLPGVGPATAEAIIVEREENGPFASPEDIKRVSGIGDKKFEDMKDSICV